MSCDFCKALQIRVQELERMDVRNDEKCRIYEERIKKLNDELEKMRYTANCYQYGPKGGGR